MRYKLVFYREKSAKCKTNILYDNLTPMLSKNDELKARGFIVELYKNNKLIDEKKLAAEISNFVSRSMSLGNKNYPTNLPPTIIDGISTTVPENFQGNTTPYDLKLNNTSEYGTLGSATP